MTLKRLTIILSLLACTGIASAADAEFYNQGNPPGRPFSLAVRAGDVVYLSGQLGTDDKGLVPGGFEAQSRKAMENVAAILKGMDLGMDNVIKCTIMIADMKKWADFNKVYVSYFKPDRLPARSALGANGLALGGEVEVECMAYAPLKK
ncbi:reactive intermediate/imine deaminase [Duganella sacchari]|uniref:Reactive intermediate/imine deaminase n=1 Tax=Duganella sacchari TaxID=551987 RepID=A0A1M7LC49_9BURK|nr:RidA family protein [Duganella sacchari]SHM75447.1 reactive intermediate/imine deaminase [Duganella sacchari]